MKQIVSNYSYSPATNVVTLTGVNIDADQLLLIVAPQVGRTLYNFASVTGTVSAGADTRVTLNASTAGLTTTSPLVIFYDDQASTQTVAGTVTANVQSLPIIFSGANVGTLGSGNFITDSAGPANDLGIGIAYNTDITDPSLAAVVSETAPLPVQVLGGSVTIGSLPAISGTVTANTAYATSITGYAGGVGSVTALPVVIADKGIYGGNLLNYNGTNTSLNISVKGIGSVSLESATNFPVSGTVTANAILQNANAMAQAFIDESNAYGSVSVVLSGSAGDIGVAGTVTAAAPNGSLTTRFGTPTTANVSFATSAVTNANRKYLLIQNVTTGSNVITVGIGFTPTTTQGIQLTAGAGITFESSYIPTGAVYVLSSVTASNFTILEA